MQEISNGLLWGVQAKGADFYVTVLRHTAKQFSTIATVAVKPGPNMKPNLLEVSESGVYAIVSFSDYHYKNGEVYMAFLNEKAKLQLEKIKKLEKPLSSVCFEPIYNDQYGNSQACETFDESPEFLVGTSIGEIFVGELVKKKVRLEFVKSMRASTYMSFQGNDCNAIRCIRILNVNNQSKLVFPELKEFYMNPVFNKVNVTMVILCCGIVCEMYVQSCTSLSQLTFDEATSFEFHELQNLAVGENIPLFEYYGLQLAAEKLQFFWVVQSFMGKNIALEKIVFNFDEILASACAEIVKACGVLTQFSGDSDPELLKLAELPEFPPAASLQTIRGIEQLRGAMLDMKTEDAILGFWISEYHLILVLASQIVVINLISEQKTEILSNIFTEPFQLRFALRPTASRADNYTPFENYQVVSTGVSFSSFGDVFAKKGEFPASCSQRSAYLNFMALPASLSKDKEASIVFLEPGDETVNLWRYYLAEEDFDNAMRFSRGEQDENAIKRQQADYCLSRGDGCLAAQLFAESDCNMVVKFQELVKIKKFDVCTQFMEERMRIVFDKYELFKKPVMYTEDKLDQMDFNSREDYYQVCAEFQKIQQFRYLAVQLHIEALIVFINFLQKEQEKQSVDLYKFYGIKSQTTSQAGERKQDQVAANQLVKYKSQLAEFITKKDSRYYPYIIKNILQNSLINANLDFIYAEYCTSTNDADFTINFHVQRFEWDAAVANLKSASNEQFLAYLDKIIVQRPRECFSIIQYKMETLRNEFRYNMLYPILRQHLSEIKSYAIDFCRWLCFEFKIKNELSISFVINSLSELEEEELLLQVLRELIENGAKVDLMYVLQVSRSKRLRNLEADCLYRLGRPVDALNLQFKTFNSISISELKNIENSEKNEIYFGVLEKVFDSFSQLEARMASVEFQEDRRALYLGLFKWFMNVEIVQKPDEPEGKRMQMLHQVRYRELQRVFTLIEAVPFLTQLDGIQEIPRFFNVATTRELTNDLALFNQARAAQIESVITSSAEVLEANQHEIAEQSKRVVSVYGALGGCQLCGRQISAKPDAYVNVSGLTVFPCGHCWHTCCLVKHQSQKGKHGAKELIQRWRTYERENGSQVYAKGAQIVEELAKKCPKCCDESIDRCLDTI